MLLSVKIVFRAKKIARDKEKHHIVMEGSMHQEDIMILNVHNSNNRASRHMKQKLTEPKGELDKSTIIAEDCNTPLST